MNALLTKIAGIVVEPNIQFVEDDKGKMVPIPSILISSIDTPEKKGPQFALDLSIGDAISLFNGIKDALVKLEEKRVQFIAAGMLDPDVMKPDEVKPSETKPDSPAPESSSTPK